MSPLFGLGLSALSSGLQLFKGNKQEKEAQEAIDNFEFQDLDNVYEDMPISTVGSDIIREEASRTTAGMVDAARSGGVRGVLSELPKIQQYSNDVNSQAAMDLDNQIRERNRLIAEDEKTIRAMNEQRQANELAGLGQKLATGQQNFLSGMDNLANIGMSAGFTDSLRDPTPQQKKVQVQSMGIVGTAPKMVMPSVLSSTPSTLYNNYLSTSSL
ncbi:hypothetical protein K1F50_09570 [Muricauda oceani]|uniref:Uncharacterized protein n=1 Tax=Flagellimonas oceani TaxID=2698672 RepID=A0A6G7J7R0_9FLAO|nr:hypothetical protein [Allomuricauda oceani]MBW8243047.1 hypothetical protein [Allomuricauda oceani]QII46598.1 hypothetical protein GVT53_18565 [Allomuricauda oceani]